MRLKSYETWGGYDTESGSIMENTENRDHHYTVQKLQAVKRLKKWPFLATC